MMESYLDRLNSVDRILAYAQPNEGVIAQLDPLLESGLSYIYFFRKLHSSAWLEPLKNAGYFDPEQNPLSYEVPDEPGAYRFPVWHALEYVERVAKHIQKCPCDKTVSLLVEIVNAIINYTDDSGDRIENRHTDWVLVNILGTFPMERMERLHITFIGVALQSVWEDISSDIGRKILPKFLNEDAGELTLALLEVILDAKVIYGQIIANMEEYWLREALNTHGQAIAKLCGVEAAQIALAQIRTLIREGASAFDAIERIEGKFDNPHESYAELLVNFTNRMFQLAKPDSIAETVAALLQESHAIFGLIALNAIQHHYEDLKPLSPRSGQNEMHSQVHI